MEKTFDIASIAQITGGQLIGSCNDSLIDDLLIDSRKTGYSDSSLFFALIGQRNNGHNYIQQLSNNGINKFIVSELQDIPEDNCQILVKDTLVALQQLATHRRELFGGKVVGITGSNGKTIVKEWLYQLLCSKGESVTRSPKSYNSQVGVPLSLWQIKPHHEIALIEAGISLPGEMSRLASMIQPTAGILTNIRDAHSENFKTQEEKLIEKLQLFKATKILFFCADYGVIEALDKANISIPELVFWSTKNYQANLFIEKVHKRDTTTRIQGVYLDRVISIVIPFIDDASIENAIHCWLYMLHSNFSDEFIESQMHALQPIKMRLELKEGINRSTIINDSYNSDLVSLEVALDLLKEQHQHINKTVIISDILQQEKNKELLYNQVSQLLKKKKIDSIIAIGDEMMEHSAKFQGLNISFFPSTSSFLETINLREFADRAILIKGARKFSFERVSHALEYKNHETVLEINLSAIAHNFNYFKSQLSANVKVMAIVKAFSYGSGGYEIANILQYNKVDYLAVAYIDEGVDLRKAGISVPIMVMNPDPSGFDVMINYNLEPEIYRLNLLQEFQNTLSQLNPENKKAYPIHIKIDTGMHRLGFTSNEISPLLSFLHQHSNIKVASVFSHLAGSDDTEHDEFTHFQIDCFKTISKKIQEQLPYTFDRHIVNSAGIVRFPEAHFDMVRLGIGLHGVSANKKTKVNLRSSAILKTVISQIKTLNAGETIGYNRRGKFSKDVRIATVAIGYADGYGRLLGNGKGKMMIHGKYAPTVGDICMDMCMLDVSNIDCKEGDEVIVFGSGYSLTDFANDAETIPYEMLTRISRRVKRVYYQE